MITRLRYGYLSITILGRPMLFCDRNEAIRTMRSQAAEPTISERAREEYLTALRLLEADPQIQIQTQM